MKHINSIYYWYCSADKSITSVNCNIELKANYNSYILFYRNNDNISKKNRSATFKIRLKS